MTAAVDEVVRSIKRMKEEHDDYYFLFDNLIDDLIDSLSSIRDNESKSINESNKVNKHYTNVDTVNGKKVLSAHSSSEHTENRNSKGYSDKFLGYASFELEDGTDVYYPIDIYGDLVANEDAWKFIKKQGLPKVTFKSDESKSISEDTVKQNGKWVNKGKEGTHGTFKTKKAADAQRKAMFASGFREEPKKKLIPESLGSDVDKFQEWVDYDMKRYGRISKQTEKEVKEAGLKIVKDKYGDYQVIAGRYNESLEEISIKTNDSKTEVKAEDDGKIVVEVKPKEDCCEEEKEVIKPLSREDEEEIKDNSEEIEEVDDVSFDELEESFLKKVYSNIDSYKTASIKNKDGKFFVEGIIKFNSGKTKKASFIFESAGKTPRNKYKLIGESIQITPKKNAFRILGSKVGNKFVSESMNYDYRTKNLEESLRVNGRVARVLGEDIDLTDKKGSITNVLTAHKEELAKASSVKEILNLLSKWFKEEGIDTPASRRLINNVAKKKDITAAQFVVYNSILKGAGQGVI